MAETERRRLVPSTPHLSPEEIAQRSFTSSRRGYSEAEVRAFLKRLAEDLAATREREVELLGAIDSLEEQLRAPRPLNEPEMLDALGAETTRLLRSAREAAEEIRNKGEERAAQLLEQARAEAERVRAEADEFARSHTEEAEAHVASLVSEGEQRAAEAQSALETHAAQERARADHEVEEIIESARRQGREMLDEAKATRERVLADLFRRRTLLQAQIDELRSGRDHLLDAYRVVKRTFLEATGALAQVEARAAAERSVREDEPGAGGAADDAIESHLAEAAGELAVEPGAPEAALDTAPESEAGVASAAADAGDAADSSLADVDSLFARIRAGQAEVRDEQPVVEAGPTAGPDAAREPAVAESDAASADESVPEAAGVTEASEEPGPTEGSDATESEETGAGPAGTTERDAVATWRSRRTELLGPLVFNVAKRAKRAAQDDQNALLDAVRRHKGRPSSEQVLVPEVELLTTWTAVVQDSLDEAYGAGRAMVGGEPARADDELAREAAATIVLPVRERIAAAIDSGEEGDTGGLVERIGARFREWKNQSLEDALVDVLALAWSRGVYDASPDGAVLRWIPIVEGRCADCDDNGLEPTVKGSSFPTGQLHPPAHPGCRCLLAPADLLVSTTST